MTLGCDAEDQQRSDLCCFDGVCGSEGDCDRLHHFVSDGVWDEAPLERELVIQADKLVGGVDVNAGRKTIPFARFDAKRCAQGLESLRPTASSGMRRREPSRRSPSTTGPLTAPTLGATCRSRGAPMRELEEKKAPIGIPRPDLTMDQFIDLEDEWSVREDRV
jgi:hypothetical protein